MREIEGATVLDSVGYQKDRGYRQKTYLKGHLPDVGGELVEGWTGQETVIDRPIVRAFTIFNVKGDH